MSSINAESTQSNKESDLKPALLELLKPPDDLHDRMSQRLAERLQRRQDLEVLGSMLGVPKETGEVFVLDEDSSPEAPPRPESARLVANSTDDPPGVDEEG